MTMDAEKKIRVLIVDDSAFMRKVLEEIIASDPRLEVVGQAPRWPRSRRHVYRLFNPM